MKIIYLTSREHVLVDDDDYARLAAHRWCPSVNLHTTYAMRSVAGRTIYMHREILQPDAAMHVDHIDGNGLNNQRANLRPATMAQNLANQRRRSDNTSGIKGVTWDRQTQMWRAQIHVHGKHVCLGRYRELDDARQARCHASARYFGELSRPGEP